MPVNAANKGPRRQRGAQRTGRVPMVYASRGMSRRQEIHSPRRARGRISDLISVSGNRPEESARAGSTQLVTVPIKRTSFGTILRVSRRPSTTTSCISRIIHEAVFETSLGHSRETPPLHSPLPRSVIGRARLLPFEREESARHPRAQHPRTIAHDWQRSSKVSSIQGHARTRRSSRSTSRCPPRMGVTSDVIAFMRAIVT